MQILSLYAIYLNKNSCEKIPWNAVTEDGDTTELGWGLAMVVMIDGADTDNDGVTWLIAEPFAWRPFNAWTCWIA